MKPQLRRLDLWQWYGVGRDTRGNIAIVAACRHTVCNVMVASSAVDFGGGVDARTQLQAAADAAVLAGAARLATGQSDADKEELGDSPRAIKVPKAERNSRPEQTEDPNMYAVGSKLIDKLITPLVLVAGTAWVMTAFSSSAAAVVS